MQYNMLTAAGRGENLSMEAAEANDLRQQVVAIIYLLIFILSGVMFISWFRRAYANLHKRVSGLEHQEVHAAWCWFIPILNLFRPYQIMMELYRRTDQYLSERRPDYQPALDYQKVGWWWGFWVLSSILGQIVFRTSIRAEDIDSLTMVTVLNMVASAANMAAAFLAVQAVKGYASREPLLRDMTEEELAIS